MKPDQTRLIIHTKPVDPDEHSEELELAFRAALERAGQRRGDLTGYIGAYCDNEDCEARQVVIRFKHADKAPDSIRCPLCGELMLLGAYGDGDITTTSEHAAMKREQARFSVFSQLRADETPGGFLVVFNGTEMRNYSLDELADLFRKRDRRLGRA